VVEVCIGVIEDRGIDSQGIYRIPGNAGVVHELQEQLDRVCIYTFISSYKHNAPLHSIQLIYDIVSMAER